MCNIHVTFFSIIFVFVFKSFSFSTVSGNRIQWETVRRSEWRRDLLPRNWVWNVASTAFMSAKCDNMCSFARAKKASSKPNPYSLFDKNLNCNFFQFSHFLLNGFINVMCRNDIGTKRHPVVYPFLINKKITGQQNTLLKDKVLYIQIVTIIFEKKTEKKLFLSTPSY